MSTSVRSDFNVELSEHALSPNTPQRIGRLLWAPMLAMALMAFVLGLAIGLFRSNLVASGSDPAMIAALGHLGPAAMFFGFASVLAAISFAIARILGVLRNGGGRVQETAGGLKGSRDRTHQHHGNDEQERQGESQPQPDAPHMTP